MILPVYHLELQKIPKVMELAGKNAWSHQSDVNKATRFCLIWSASVVASSNYVNNKDSIVGNLLFHKIWTSVVVVRCKRQIRLISDFIPQSAMGRYRKSYLSELPFLTFYIFPLDCDIGSK